jgi:hypothetical protein
MVCSSHMQLLLCGEYNSLTGAGGRWDIALSFADATHQVNFDGHQINIIETPTNKTWRKKPTCSRKFDGLRRG